MNKNLGVPPSGGVGFFSKIFNFQNISLKIGYFELDNDYDLTVTSYTWDDALVLFLVYVERGAPSLAILWYQLDVSRGFIFKFAGGNHPPPLVRRITKT